MAKYIYIFLIVITYFSTFQDTVDHAELEDNSKNESGSPNKIRRKWKKRHHRTVINPYGNAYFYWLCILTICVLYNLWTAIVRQSFPQLQSNYVPMWWDEGEYNSAHSTIICGLTDSKSQSYNNTLLANYISYSFFLIHHPYDCMDLSHDKWVRIPFQLTQAICILYLYFKLIFIRVYVYTSQFRN